MVERGTAALLRCAIWRIVLATAVVTSAVITGTAHGQRLDISGPEEVAAARWQRLTNQPPFHTDSANLMTDGTVLVHEYGTPNWWRLTPDVNGSYLNGTWSQVASLQHSYGPLYFANAVLPDGRLIVEGGEYNLASQSSRTKAQSTTR